jgi:hypothetical protein
MDCSALHGYDGCKISRTPEFANDSASLLPKNSFVLLCTAEDGLTLFYPLITVPKESENMAESCCLGKSVRRVFFIYRVNPTSFPSLGLFLSTHKCIPRNNPTGRVRLYTAFVYYLLFFMPKLDFDRGREMRKPNEING